MSEPGPERNLFNWLSQQGGRGVGRDTMLTIRSVGVIDADYYHHSTTNRMRIKQTGMLLTKTNEMVSIRLSQWQRYP